VADGDGVELQDVAVAKLLGGGDELGIMIPRAGGKARGGGAADIADAVGDAGPIGARLLLGGEVELVDIARRERAPFGFARDGRFCSARRGVEGRGGLIGRRLGGEGAFMRDVVLCHLTV
jgi:hypothetical protein